MRKLILMLIAGLACLPMVVGCGQTPKVEPERPIAVQIKKEIKLWKDEDSPSRTWVIESDSENPNAVPVLNLKRDKYILGEPIRFKIGVQLIGDDTIPSKYWKECSLYITKPDGTIKKEVLGWPCDGWLMLGWGTAYELPKEEVQTGKYTLVFEFANQRTEPVEFTVEKKPEK